LLNIAYKILASIMCERLKPHVIRIVGPYQCGFMPGKSTTDQIFTLRQILEKTHEFQVDRHHLFVDFKQAYDTHRDELFAAMNQLLIKLSQMTLKNTRSCVKAAGTTTNTLRTIRGIVGNDHASRSCKNKR
ncbi:reverse transcriptase domain-containing protein, partial [Streptomyces djakartensis]|uniref:reverse transcriptase domain-containing protein n=1 Tax=Streptomyces djakartensis TaxID=68193 RepID=UPI0034DE1571